MADNKDLSVQEILALCRQQDGGGADAEASPAEGPSGDSSAVAATTAAESEPTATAAKATEIDPSKMSVADMLAAARAEKGGGGAVASTADGSASPTQESTPAAKPAVADRSKMSVADMLAAARAEKGGGEAEKAKPVAKASPKPKPASKAAAKAPAAAKKSGPMDTSSILAAARSASKPGPITKAEAAAKAKATPGAAKPEKPKAPPMPPKPEYAKLVAAPAKAKGKGADRRTVLEVLFGSMLAIGFGAMTMVTGLWALVTARFFFPNLLVEPPNQFKVGFPGDFSAGTVTTKFKAQYGVWVVSADYEGQQQIVALKSVCTHLGCTPNWLEAEQKFKCPCHGSGFYKDGINFEGPAPRPLERYAIKVADDGQIEIDKARTFQEQLGQWRDGASFVPV